MSNLGSMAVEYAERGWAVFPIYGITEENHCTCAKGKACENPGKHPISARGFLDATTNIKTIKNWWGSFPNANIGIATGEKSGIFVMDIDGPHGVASIMDKELPKTLTAASGREDGGIHYYFQAPEFRVKNAIKTLPGLDIRADGGYIIAPPSKHVSGKEYVWTSEDEPAPAPQWLLDRLEESSKYDPSVDEEFEPIETGSRNVYLTGVAGSMRRKGLSYAAIRAALLIHNQERLLEPLPASEVEKIAESISQKPASDVNPPSIISFIVDAELGEISYDPICLNAELTDLGNAEVFAKLYAGKFLYDHTRKKWMVWADGTNVWREDGTNAAMRAMMASLRMRKQAALMISDDRERSNMLKAVRRAENGRALQNSLDKAATFTTIATTTETFNSNISLINLLNGTYDLESDEFRSSRPLDYISRQAVLEYDPEAKAPHWEKFIHDVFDGNKELADYVQRALGLCLSGDISEQAFFVAFGSGANGKSTMLNTVERLLGDYGKVTPFDTFDADSRNQYGNDLASLQGSRMVIAIESEQSRKLAEARIKSITGGDTVACRFLYGEFFQFRPQFKTWLAVNHRPIVRGSDHGIWRRIHLIPFTQRFEGAHMDKHLENKLSKEYAGIFNWLLEGYRQWRLIGLKPPKIVMDATTEYKRENDYVALWLEERCDKADGKAMLATEGYEDFRNFLRESGEIERAIPSMRNWTQLMSEKGFVKSRNNTGRWKYDGVELAPLIVGKLHVA